MLKETVICVISVIIIILGNNITNSYANDSMNYISSELGDLRKIVLEDNDSNEKSKNKIDEIFNQWYQIYNKLAYFIEHDELEKVQDNLTQIRSNIEMEEKQETIVTLDSTVFILKHIEEKLDLKLENIF